MRRTLVCALRDRDGVAVSQPFLGVSSLDFGPLLREWPFFLREVPRTYSAAIRRGVVSAASVATSATTARKASTTCANPCVIVRLASFM